MKINYLHGDLFDTVQPGASLNGKAVFVPHVCNDLGLMRSGFVAPLCAAWPEVRTRYEAWHAGEDPDMDGPMQLGEVQFVTPRSDADGSIHVCNMIAQHETIRTQPKPIRYAALCRCMQQVATAAGHHDQPEIHGPMFGSDLARGSWPFIVELIEELWLAAGIPVSVHVLDADTHAALTGPG